MIKVHRLRKLDGFLIQVLKVSVEGDDLIIPPWNIALVYS